MTKATPGLLLLLLILRLPGQAQIHAPIPSDAAQTAAGERLALLRPICGSEANGNGCAKCPAGTEFPNDRLELRTVFYGHFLASDSDDAAVGFIGCEDHADGRGGAFLLSRQNGLWRRVAFRPAAVIGDCKKLRAPDGHEALVCFGQDMHQGVVDDFLYLLDFTVKPPPESALDTFFMLDNSVADCALMLTPQDGLIAGGIERVLISPAGHISVQARLGRIGSSEFQLVSNYCTVGEASPLVLRIATIQRTYNFWFDGTRIASDPGNPPMSRNYALAPETHAIVPLAYAAPDGSFTIAVPAAFKIVRNPGASRYAVCSASALVCFLDSGSVFQGGIEISRIAASNENTCLSPDHIPGRSTHFEPGQYSQTRILAGQKSRYQYWIGPAGEYRLEQGIYRVWHGGVCYQVAENVAQPADLSNRTGEDGIWQGLVRVAQTLQFSPH